MGTKLESGTLYVKKEATDEWTLLCNVEGTEITSSEEYAEDCYPLSNISRAFDEFSGTCRISADVWRAFIGITNEFLYSICPNKRVVWLANHAKKKRDRKKNIHRIIRILETMNEQDQ